MSQEQHINQNCTGSILQIPRHDKERLLFQHSRAIWFTGFSGAGKTTLAIHLEHWLNRNGFLTQLLDGDLVRKGISNNLGFSESDRWENIRRIAEVNKLLLQSGVITINAFISPTRAIREMAKSIIGPEDFTEIYVSTPLHICEQRDPKGLYKLARARKISNFTGVDAPFEPPESPDICIDTSVLSIQESIDQIIQNILPKITYQQ